MFHVELQAQADFQPAECRGRDFKTRAGQPPARGLATVAWAAVQGTTLLLLDGRIDSPPEPEEMVELIIERPDAGLARPNDLRRGVSI
jgi:hypothetical protein